MPTDFSEHAERALETALALRAEDGAVDLLHCWRLPSALPSAWAPDMDAGAVVSLCEELAAAVEALGDELVTRFAERCPQISFRHIEEAASAGILQQLEKSPYDLVVMGSHGRRGLRRWLLGSVAEATVRHAPCSVVVTHTPHDQSGGATTGT